jgi:hypothetical protein
VAPVVSDRIVDVSRRARARGVASSFRVLARISARGPGREAWREGVNEGLLRLTRLATAAAHRVPVAVSA